MMDFVFVAICAFIVLVVLARFIYVSNHSVDISDDED